MEHHFLDHFSGKIRSIGTSEKVVLFPRRNVPNENSCSISLKPSLIPVSGFDGIQICTNTKRDSGTKVTAYQSRILLTIYANRNRPVCRSFSSFSLNKYINISDWAKTANIWNIFFDFTDYALHFPTKGVSDYVDIWGMPSLTQFTVCLWMKKNGTSSYGTMFYYGAPDQRTEIRFGYNEWGFPNLVISSHGLRYIFHLRKMK